MSDTRFLVILLHCSFIAFLIVEIFFHSDLEIQSLSPAFAQTVSPDFNFGSAGDWACTANTENTVNNMVSKKVELVLGLGDYSYEDTADCWLDIMEPIDQKMKIAIGNHEDRIYDQTYNNGSYDYPRLLKEYMNAFDLTTQYYSFNYQNVHFLTMSIEVAADRRSEQFEFVKNDLAAASNNSSIDWIVVFLHSPFYNSPVENIDSIDPSLIAIYHPMFDRYEVDLVLQVHNHNYQRSYPLKFNPSEPNTPTKTSTKEHNYTNPKGEIYVTVGTGGAPPLELKEKASYIVAQQAGAYGFLNVDIINNGRTMEATFYANDGKTKDHFKISK